MCTQKRRIIIFEVRDSARVRERDERCHAQGWSRHTYIIYMHIWSEEYSGSLHGTVCVMIIPGAHAAEDAAYTCLFYALMAL